MSFDPTQAGYAFTGINDPNVYALLTDYEQADWNSGAGHRPRAAPPGRPTSPRPSRCCGGWNFGFTSTAATTRSAPASAPVSPHRTSLTGTYGQIAQNLNKQNTRLGDRKLGPHERSDPGRLR